jgi:hypothetical protein
VAQSFTCGADKTAYIAKFGLLLISRSSWGRLSQMVPNLPFSSMSTFRMGSLLLKSMAKKGNSVSNVTLFLVASPWSP